MTVISSIICPSSEEFRQVVFDQQGAPEYAQYLGHRPAKLEVVLDNCNEAVCDDGDVNLYPDSILGITPERLNLEMLFNPPEEKFHLPAVALKQGDAFGRKLASCMHNLSDFDSDHNIRISKVGHGFYCSKRYA